MIDVNFYLNDGAKACAQVILCILRSRQYEFKEKTLIEGDSYSMGITTLDVGRFENCREQGYIFGLTARGFEQLADKWMVVEHRTSDDIRVRHFLAKTVDTPTVDTVYDEENLVSEKFFSWNDYNGASDYIIDGMVDAVDKYMESEDFLRTKMRALEWLKDKK